MCRPRSGNSEDPDEMPQNVASHLGLNYLVRPILEIITIYVLMGSHYPSLYMYFYEACWLTSAASYD